VLTESSGPDIVSAMLPQSLIFNAAYENSAKGLVGSAGTNTLSIIAIYMVSNTLIRPKQEHAKDILEWFQLASNQNLLKSLIHRKDPTSQAMWTNMFLYAVIAENIAVLKALPKFAYSSLLNVPHAWFHVVDGPHNALEYACIRQNRQLYHSLIDLGATHSKSLPHVLQVIQTKAAFQHRGRGPMGKTQFDIGLVDAMIRNGIDICKRYDTAWSRGTASPYVNAFQGGHLELMEILFRSHSCAGCREALELKCHDDRSSCSSTMLAFLLDAGIKMPLKTAVKCQSTNAIQRILEAGSKFDGEDWKLVCQQTDQQSILSIFDLHRKHRVSKKAGDSSSPTITEEAQYTSNRPGSYSFNEPALLSLDNKADHPLRLRHTKLIISCILSLPRKYAMICLDECLNTAVESGCEYSVRELLSAGVTSKTDTLQRAKGSNMVSLLLKNTWSCENSSSSIFRTAVETGDSSTIYLLMDAGFDVNSLDQSAPATFKHSLLTHAICCEQSEIISQLLERGADVSGRMTRDSYHSELLLTTPLIAAIKQRNTHLIHKLIELGANIEDEFALRAAVVAGNDIFYILLAHHRLKLCLRKPKFALPTLQLAIIRKNIDVVRSLLKHGASVHECWEHDQFWRPDVNTPQAMFHPRQTALETAIIEDKNPDLSILKLVLSAWKGQDCPWIGPVWNRTCPLSLAVKHSNYHAIDLLLSPGVDLKANTQGNSWGSPLEIASEIGDLQVVQKLISLGADVNAIPRNPSRLPALQYAAQNGFTAVAELLLKNGAFVDVPGPRPSSWTALELAARNGRIDMIQLLVNHGAQLYGAAQFERAKRLSAENKHIAITDLLESLWTKQFAALNHNFHGQSMLIGDVGILDDDQEQGQTGGRSAFNAKFRICFS
jgi:ankyrin repeat protein